MWQKNWFGNKLKTSFFSISLTDLRMSLRDLSAILRILSFVMLLPLAATFYYMDEPDLDAKILRVLAFVLPSALLYALYYVFNKLSVKGSAKTKHIMVTFALTWIVIAFVGMIPFEFRSVFASPLDSFFESMSGWTTTGFSMIRDIESQDKDILLYRSITQGVGGLGVISLGLMVLLQGGKIGVGYGDVGVQRIKPGIKQTIKEAWKIYGLYIILGIVLLYIAGMTFFDAINFSITAVATGGFATHSDAGYYNSFTIEAILVFLMCLGMTSFIIHYRVFTGDRKAFSGTELKYTYILMVCAIFFLSLAFFLTNPKGVDGIDTSNPFSVLWTTTFHVVSGMSTCGYNTVDFGTWPDFSKTIMVGLMYVGGMASSTAGGIRVIRFVIIIKAIHYSLKKLILPKSALVVVKLDGKTLQEDIMTVVGYSAVYLTVALGLGLILMLLGYDSVDSVLTIMSALGYDGLGVLSGGDWYDMHVIGKLSIIFAMWVGRIEIFASLLILRSLLEKLQIIQ